MTSRRSSVASHYSRSVEPMGTYKGTVTAVSSQSVSVLLPRLLPTPFTGLKYYGPQPAVGATVWAMFIEGNPGHPLIMSNPGDIDSPSASSSFGFAGNTTPANIGDRIANPIGMITPWAGLAASPVPTGWLLCDGTAVSRATYDELFALIGTQYGVGDGSTTFNVPDLRGRVIMGLDNMGASSANVVVDASADTVGGTLGTETHTLTEAELPSHTHTGPSHSHTITHTHDINHNHASFNSGNNHRTHTHNTDPASFTSGSGGSHSHGPGTGTGFIHAGSGTSQWTTSGGTTFGTTNTTDTEASHTHAINVPSTTSGDNNRTHYHAVDVPALGVTASGASSSASTGLDGTAATGAVGSGTAHSSVQPSMALNYLISV